METLVILPIVVSSDNLYMQPAEYFSLFLNCVNPTSAI